MDHTGEYKLAIQIGQRGFYAHVWLTALPDLASDLLKIEFRPDDRPPPDFQTAIRSGIETAWRKCRHADPSLAGLLVREVRLHHMVVDSTSKCVASAAAGALLKAIGMERLLPQFQPDMTFGQMIATFDAE